MDFTSQNKFIQGHRQGLNRSLEAIKQLTRRIIRGTELGWNHVQRTSSDNSITREKETMKMTYIFINGILCKPGSIMNWNERACTWVDQRTKFKADRYEYHADALFRRIGQEKRVDDLETLVKRLSQGDIILVGHSNGCDLIERLVKRNTHYFKEIHLIAAASENDFYKNGFNEALKNKQVGSVHIYMSKKDEALKEAKLSTRLFGWMGLGYGYLGLVGAQNVSPMVISRVNTIEKPFKHSEWFDDKNFDSTMQAVTQTK